MIQRTLLFALVSLLSAACTARVAPQQQSLTSAEHANPALLVQTTNAPPTIVLTEPLVLPTATAEPAPPTPTFQAEPTQIAPPEPLPQAQAELSQPGQQCMPSFEQRELQEPYQRDKYTNAARYTLSAPELKTYLDVMGIESICVPVELGTPFLNVDWDSAQMTAQTGRMFSIGFEDLYPGAGWSDGYIVYATFDFALGTEYDTFASLQDRDAVRNNTMPDMIEVNGVQGFTRIQPSAFGFGSLAVYKTFVFPFENHYVAVVYNLGFFEVGEDWDAAIQELEAGNYPDERRVQEQAIDWLATSIQFQSPSP